MALNVKNTDTAAVSILTGLTTLSSVCDSSGANSVVAAPAAGYHHVLCAFQLIFKEAPATLQVALLKSSTTEMWNFSSTKIDDGIYIEFAPGMELHWGSAQAIVINLAEAKDVAYVLRYKTIAD